MDLVKAEKLAKELMQLHGLLPKWKFKFDNSKRRFGVCAYSRLGGLNNELFNCHIGLSKPLVMINDEAKVRDVILHEIAHALTIGHGHDNVWKRKCIEIGAKPERCYSMNEVNTLQNIARYQAVCGGCGKVHGRHRMTTRILNSRIACKCQSGKSWDNKELLKYIDTKAV